jgi:hypothetical protein
MSQEIQAASAHPLGESIATLVPVGQALGEPLRVETAGGCVHVAWDPDAPVTPLGQLVFFAQFLEVSGHFAALCADVPLQRTSPNAPAMRDVVGTAVLGVLCGQKRYAHLAALRFDPVNPGLLGMQKVASEDSVRRFFGAMEPDAAARWLSGHLRQCWEGLLTTPWVLDVDTTIKPIYGHQEGATKGYNPQKPGRPSHAYHSYFIGRARLCLDVEVEEGRHHAAKHGHAGLWRLVEELPVALRPAAIRGDLAYGEENFLRQCEEHGQGYLFKLRQSPKVKELIRALERQSGWSDAGQGFEGLSGRLKLKAWSQERRVVVLRRLTSRARTPAAETPLLEAGGLRVEAAAAYEFMVLVTSLELPVESLAQMYRDRADVENCFDELKNQWGWGGFTTADLGRSRSMAKLVALVYNWWSVFVGLAEPARHAEAITSRPSLLVGVARVVRSARQTTLLVTSTHAQGEENRLRLSAVSAFLTALAKAAEQLTRPERWRRILSAAFARFFDGELIPPLANGLPSPT